MSKFLLSLCDCPGKMQSVEFSPSTFFGNSKILDTGRRKVYRSSIGTSKLRSCRISPSKDPYEFIASPVKFSSHASMGIATEDLSEISDSDSHFEQQKNSLQKSRPVLFGITDEEDDGESRSKNGQSINRIHKSGKPASKRFQKSKSLSAPHAVESKLFNSRTSLSSPPKKHRRYTSESLRLGVASRAKRSLDYGQGKTLHKSITPSEDIGKSLVLGEIGKMYWSVYETEKENIHQNQRKKSPVILNELDDAENEAMKGAKRYGDSQKSNKRNNMIAEAINNYQEEATGLSCIQHTWPSTPKKCPAPQKEFVLQESTNGPRQNMNPSSFETSSISSVSEETIENSHDFDDLGRKTVTANEMEMSPDISNILPIFKDLDDADSELITEDGERIRHISPGPSERSEPEYIGFPNPEGANLCWFNSGLQILLAMTPFLEDLQKLLKSSEWFDSPSLLQNFIGLVRMRRKGQKEELYNFHRKFLRSFIQCTQFQEEVQHDAGEFLSLFFEKLHESIKKNGVLREQDLNKLTFKKDDVLHRRLGTEESNQNFWSSPLRENLQHVLKETNFCLKCSKQLNGGTACAGTFVYQCIPEHSEQLSLQEILEQRQTLPELNCKCGAFGARTEKAFSVLPRFLFFQMGRYDTSRNKLKNKMIIPLILSLKKLVDKDVSLPVSWEPANAEERCCWEEAVPLSTVEKDEDSHGPAFASKSKMEEVEHLTDTRRDSDYKYCLMGIILHKGDNLLNGHYTADVFSLEKQRWYHYNDDTVSPLEPCEVLGERREQEGYVFLYIHKKLFDQMS